MNKIQCSFNSAYHGLIHFWENMIQACQEHLSLIVGLTKPPHDTSKMIYSLYSSIINYKVVHKSTLSEIICNLTMMRKMMRYFLPIANIDKIDLHMANIKKPLIHSKIYFIYLVYLYFVLHFYQGQFNIWKHMKYMKKTAVGLLITLNRSVMT